MNAEGAKPESDDEKILADRSEVSMLIRALRDTDSRLEELTAGEVDTVIDNDGRLFLLQRAQDRWREAGVARQAAVLDALPAHIALLDGEGVILSVNAAWRSYGDANGLLGSSHFVGKNYLSCQMDVGTEGVAAYAGVQDVLAGRSNDFSLEYPCDSSQDSRWFLLTVTAVDDSAPRGAVVMHLDITDRKQREAELRRFALAMDASPDGIFLVERHDMGIVEVNDAGCRLLGMNRSEVLTVKPWEYIGISRERLERSYDDVIANGGFAEPEEALWERNGAPPIWIETRRHARRINDRWVVVSLLRDITARRDAEDRIAHLNRVRALLGGINALIVRVTDKNELFREACRIAVEQGELAMAWMGLVDQHNDKVVPVSSAGIEADFLEAITGLLAANSLNAPGGSLPLQVASSGEVFVSNDSQNDARVSLGEMHVRYGIQSLAIFPLRVTEKIVGVFVLYAREKGFFHVEQLALLTQLANDVAFAIEHIEKQETLDYLVYYDALTGLANRSLFLERVAEHVGVAGSQKLAVCVMDLERFKNINNSLGRALGDSLLRQVALWLIHETGDSNLVARIDADRFAFLIPAVTNEDEVARFLEGSMERFLEHAFDLNDKPYRISAKVGVALLPEDGDDAEALLKHAEIALKKAKLGGEQYLFYAQKMTETVVGRLNMENQLRRALALDQFVLHYQPKINSATGELSGAEALIRWNDPSTGMVPPGQFIPILEETGLIHEVGRWALGKALGDYLRWREQGLRVVRVAVNLSPLQLRQRNFISEMSDILGIDAAAAGGLELEITESLIMADVKLSIATLQAIRAMGVKIAIDDFGTGFSSLSYLSKLPVDTIKIDRSFIHEMVNGKDGLTLVSIIINLAHALKLNIVAEGVESEEQRALLTVLKCDEMQGFLFSRPLPAEAFEKKYLS